MTTRRGHTCRHDRVVHARRSRRRSPRRLRGRRWRCVHRRGRPSVPGLRDRRSDPPGRAERGRTMSTTTGRRRPRGGRVPDRRASPSAGGRQPRAGRAVAWCDGLLLRRPRAGLARLLAVVSSRAQASSVCRSRRRRPAPRSMCRSIVRWQAVIVVVIAGRIGIPAGVVVGPAAVGHSRSTRRRRVGHVPSVGALGVAVVWAFMLRSCSPSSSPTTRSSPS